MKVVIDGRYSKDKAMLHNHIKSVLNFPEYYGRNLDALFDLLSVYSEETEIEFTHGKELEENLGNYAGALVRTFKEAAAENKNIKICFSENESE